MSFVPLKMHSFGLPQARGLAKAIDITSTVRIRTQALVPKTHALTTTPQHVLVSCLYKWPDSKFSLVPVSQVWRKPLKMINFIYLAGVVQIQDRSLNEFYPDKRTFHYFAIKVMNYICCGAAHVSFCFISGVQKNCEIQTSWEGGIGCGRGHWAELHGRGETRAKEVGEPRFC